MDFLKHLPINGNETEQLWNNLSDTSGFLAGKFLFFVSLAKVSLSLLRVSFIENFVLPDIYMVFYYLADVLFDFHYICMSDWW